MGKVGAGRRLAAVGVALLLWSACVVGTDEEESVAEPTETPEVNPENHTPEGGSCSGPSGTQAHCQAGLTCCLEASGQFGTHKCRDTNSDENHCGACGNKCNPTTDQCINGSCVCVVWPWCF